MTPHPRTPYFQMPITVMMKAIAEKTYRNAHCFECGMPICQITDKIVTVFDGGTPIEQLQPDDMGIVGINCSRFQCRQRYRLEFAV